MSGKAGSDEIERLFSGNDGAPLPIVASIFTPYQLLMLERIMETLPPRDVLVIDARPARFRDGRAPRIPGARYLACDLSGKVIDGGQARLVRDLLVEVANFRADRPIAFLCASFQRHFNTVALRHWRGDGGVRWVLMDDGLSTFLDLGTAWTERLRNFVREALAGLLGYPRRASIPGHPLGLDIPGLAGIILSLDARPERDHGRPYVLLPPSRATLGPGDPAKALFIGQPYAMNYGWKRLEPLIAGVVADLRARGLTDLAFKPHHFQKREEIDRYLAHGFQLVDPPVPVEEMIATSPYRAIASINTTALLTAKALFGDAVTAIAYDPTAFKPPQEKRDLHQVSALFAKAGVEIVSLSASD